MAYVIAHEIGHHIQNVFGVLNKTNAMRSKMSERGSTINYCIAELTSRLLSRWCLGRDAYATENSDVKLTYDDIMEGMRAAAAVGDDHIQEQATGQSHPESFTHGTSEQRAYWFKKGYETGDVNAGNTFNDPSLQ